METHLSSLKYTAWYMTFSQAKKWQTLKISLPLERMTEASA